METGGLSSEENSGETFHYRGPLSQTGTPAILPTFTRRPAMTIIITGPCTGNGAGNCAVVARTIFSLGFISACIFFHLRIAEVSNCSLAKCEFFDLFFHSRKCLRIFSPRKSCDRGRCFGFGCNFYCYYNYHYPDHCLCRKWCHLQYKVPFLSN